MAGQVSNTAIYAVFGLQIVLPNGSLLNIAQESSMTIDSTTGSQPVKTVQLGYAGESPGSAMTEISVDTAIPASGFEFDPTQLMAGLSSCKFVINGANSLLQFEGFIISSTLSHGVDSEAKLSFKARGGFSSFQALS